MSSKIREYFIVSMIWVCITLFYCYQYILRVLPNIIMPELMSKFNIGTTEFGTFAGIYYIGYITVHIPIGLMLSRFGGRIVLPICIILTSFGLIPIVYTQTWHFVVFGRLLIGIGSSAAIIGALQIFRVVFHNHFSRMLGIMVCLGLITAVYSSKVLTYTLANININIAINILIIGAVVLGLATFVLLPSTNMLKSEGVWADIKAIVCNYKLIMVSILAGLMVGPLEGFADAWGSAFVNAVYGVERETANAIISSILSGMCIGCIILPYIADKTDAYHGITLISAIVMTICFVYLLSASSSTTLILTGVCFIVGIFCAYQVVIISKISTYVEERLSGMAASVANMIIMAFGSIFHNAIGINTDRFWDGTINNGVRVYNAAAYLKGISIIPTAMTIAIIGFMILITFEKQKIPGTRSVLSNPT